MSNGCTAEQDSDRDRLPEWIAPYIAGLVDNHFAFVGTFSKADDRTLGYEIQFNIRYKAEDDEIVTLLQQYCEQLDISIRVIEQSDTTYAQSEVRIARRDDLATFLESVRPYLLVQTRAVTLLLDEILPAMNRGAASDKDAFLELAKTIDSFREAAGRANRATYDYDYFAEKWDQ